MREDIPSGNAVPPGAVAVGPGQRGGFDKADKGMGEGRSEAFQEVRRFIGLDPGVDAGGPSMVAVCTQRVASPPGGTARTPYLPGEGF